LRRADPHLMQQSIKRAAPLPPGAEAPDFELPSTPDQTVSLAEFRGQPVILAFYPEDWSPVCSDQLALYQELLPEFRRLDAELVGISVDGIWCHLAFAKDRNLHFPLLADFEPKGEVARTYRVYRSSEGTSERALFVIDGDGVVAGLGIVPSTELAEAAGLPVDDGIVVDELGRAGERDDVFAAGDVARFPARSLGGKLVRVEHEDHANSHGHAVGANMAGANTPYTNLPFFYSDLFELGYEAVGEVDSRLETVAAWAEPNRKGVVCYVDDGRRPRGFLLWDVWGKVGDGRALIDEAAPVEQAQLEALLQ